MKSPATLLLAIALLAPAALPDSAWAVETTLVTGKVKTLVMRRPEVRFKGVVNEVLVAPGQHVAKGERLMRYALDDDARRALQKEVRNGPAVESTEAQIMGLKRELAQSIQQRNRARSLSAKGLGSQLTTARLETDVVTLEKRIELAESTVKKHRTNFKVRMEELTEYFDSPVHEGDTLPEFLYLTSPIDGYVLVVSPSANPGVIINAGSMPIAVGQMDPLMIQVPVYENEVHYLKVGDVASVEIPSLGNRHYDATITEIAWISNESDVSQPSYFNVELTIPNSDLEVKPGFKAIVRFTLE